MKKGVVFISSTRYAAILYLLHPSIMSSATLEQATDDVAQGNKAVETFAAGWISVAVYCNKGKNGPFYSYVPQRAYKVDEETRRTNSFTGDEALVVSTLLAQAWQWVRDRKQQERRAKRG